MKAYTNEIRPLHLPARYRVVGVSFEVTLIQVGHISHRNRKLLHIPWWRSQQHAHGQVEVIYSMRDWTHRP